MTKRALRPSLWLAAVGLVLALGSLPLYALLFDQPYLRVTGLPALATGGLGAVCAALAAHRDRRRIVLALLVATLAVVAGTIWLLFGFARLPASGKPIPREAADFTLPDQNGRPTSLADRVARGPTLLVFFRGRW